MHKLESIRKNKIHIYLWDFKIKMGRVITDMTQGQVMINKKGEKWKKKEKIKKKKITLLLVNFSVRKSTESE